MIKCPNCGSTAQPKLQKIEEQELNCYTIEMTRTYKCGCGEVFTAKEYKNAEGDPPIFHFVFSAARPRLSWPRIFIIPYPSQFVKRKVEKKLNNYFAQNY